MSQATREKIALVVFLALIAATLVGVGTYMRVGHSWNRAAVSIDDASGDMQGYLAIIYRGTAVPSARAAADDETPVPVSSVVRSYRDKGAKTLRIDSLHPEIYDGTDIFLVGKTRVGVFYAPPNMTRFAIERRVKWYEKHDVDMLICLSADVEKLVGHSDGVDIVVSMADVPSVRSGAIMDHTYFTNVPVVGRVGAILVSPEGIASHKEIVQIPD